MTARVLVIVCLLASLASAKPRKAKKPRKAPPKPEVTEPTPPPTPAPAPEPAPATVVAPPPPVARAGKPRVAVIGPADVAEPFASSIASSVELVRTGDDAPRALAARHGLHAVIVVSVPSADRGLAIVYQGSDGSELGRTELKAGKFVVGKRLGPEVIAKLGDKLARATAPPPDTNVAASPSSSSSRASASAAGVRASAPRPSRAHRAIVISVEERPFWRRLRYNDDLDERLRPSDLVANAVGIGASWRPLRKLPSFSVVGRGELAVGVNGSRTSDGTEYSTSSSEWSIGAGFDVRIGAASVGVVAAFGEHRFALGDDPAMELVPDVAYRYVRGGLVVTAPLAARWDLTFTAGWRQLLGLGGMTDASWFPRATGAGIDGSAGIAFHVTPWLDVQARVDLRRYFFAMNPEPGDPWIAGGATDQYFGGALGLAISPR
ncbi:MAG: hypothetical protein H0T46_35915 [Deltaproteobacteria bacterium]|nr:hypothetical protein [Deltaproteobacteria bacterium]